MRKIGFGLIILLSILMRAAVAMSLETVPTVVLRQFPLPQPARQSFFNGRAIAFDGKTLWADFAPTYNPETKIYRVDTNGNLLKVLNIGVGVGALAFNPKTRKLYGGNYEVGHPGNVYEIDPVSGQTSLRFTFLFPPGDNCFKQEPGFIDGLEYRPDNNSLEISDDGGKTVYDVELDGTPISSFAMSATGGGCNSGIAFDGAGLWLVDVFNQKIIHTDLQGHPDKILLTPGSSPEDLAYDTRTFAPACALWANEHTFKVPTIRAYKVPCSPTFTYVALGDSIPTGQSRASCPKLVDCTATKPLPATHGYPFRLNDLLLTVRPRSVTHNFAVVGATTVHVTTKQLPRIACPAITDPDPSKAKFCPDLVSITIGANDFDLLDALTFARWLRATPQKRQEVAAMLAAQFAKTLASLVQGVRIRAPGAQIIVLTDYPNPSDPQNCSFVSSAFDDIFLAGSFTGLNEAIQAVANQNGAIFVDAYNHFTNHGIQSGNSWFAGRFCGLQPQDLIPLNAISLFRLFLFQQSFDPHPNAAGQQCFANLIWEGIKGPLGSLEPANPNPCPDDLAATASP